MGEIFNVVANPDRIKKYQTNGGNINNQIQQFNYISKETKTEPADLVIIAVKKIIHVMEEIRRKNTANA
ncbi:hypothetical protein GCM10027286_21450 [Virgibacillus ainsalahensis]